MLAKCRAAVCRSPLLYTLLDVIVCASNSESEVEAELKLKFNVQPNTLQFILGTSFYASKDQTNSVRAPKKDRVSSGVATVWNSPVASLGWLTPGTATKGVTPLCLLENLTYDHFLLITVTFH